MMFNKKREKEKSDKIKKGLWVKLKRCYEVFYTKKPMLKNLGLG